MSRGRRALALLLLAALALSLAGGVAASRAVPGETHALLLRFIAFEAAHGEASLALAFVLELLAALCGVLPASIPAIAAGLLYGVWTGFALSAAAVLLASVLSFAASRSVLRPLVAGVLARSPRARLLDAAVAAEGWRLVCLLRISPVMPFALTSYALGLTSLRFPTYLAGTLLSLPPLLGYVLLGRLARHGLGRVLGGAPATGEGRLIDLLLLGTGIAGTIGLIVLFGRVLRAALIRPASREQRA